ncbi:MAG TPA: hypothetical protein VK167_13240 [Flavipsychrobacter sp.]|nr:hypothetical protein [Flavipsychrobacter sp.]
MRVLLQLLICLIRIEPYRRLQLTATVSTLYVSWCETYKNNIYHTKPIFNEYVSLALSYNKGLYITNNTPALIILQVFLPFGTAFANGGCNYEEYGK